MAEEFHTVPDLPLNVKFCRLKHLGLCKRSLEEKRKKLIISLLHQAQVLTVVQHISLWQFIMHQLNHGTGL